jgi:Ion channel
VVLLGLRDMARRLLQPRGQGFLSGGVLALGWHLSRATGHRIGAVVGPASMLASIGLWIVMQGVGWALIYLPRVPAGFAYSGGVDPSRYSVVAEALYISFVTLATLGFGDVVAIDPAIRLLAPLQALTAGASGSSAPLTTVGLVLLGLGWSAATVAGAAMIAASVTGPERVNVQGLADSLMSLSGAAGGALAGLGLAWVGYGGFNVAAGAWRRSSR